MADTIRKNEEEKVEHFDSKEVLNEKVKLVANLILNSKHFISFTGAGISTACGIPDFRSGMNTVLKTGAGVWEKRAAKVQETKPNQNIVDSRSALPSFTHMSLIALEKVGLLKYLVSQNTDGLHLRSGFNPVKLAELHGNRMLEKCKKCKSSFLRDFRTREAKGVFEHETSRKCENCGGKLYDSIINFGENLPEYELNRSFKEGDLADVCLAMGSSLTVTPAADIPKTVGENGKLIIVNLQKTPLDDFAYVRVNALCDDFMKLLMEELNIKVEKFVLQRLLEFTLNKEQDILFRGIDPRGIPFSYLKEVEVAFDNEKKFTPIPKKELFKVSLKKVDEARIKLTFFGWLKEPELEIKLEVAKKGVLSFNYDPFTQEWSEPIWIEGFEYQKLT